MNQKKQSRMVTTRNYLFSVLEIIREFFLRIKNNLQGIKINFKIILSTITVFLIIALIVFGVGLSNRKDVSLTPKSSKDFSIIHKMENLRTTHHYYSKVATKNEILVMWIDLFSGWSYQQNGDQKFNKGDDLGAVYKYLKHWNSNFELEDVKTIVDRANNLYARGELSIRNNPGNVRHGDILILKLQGNLPDHIAIVYDIKNNHIQYLDVNSKLQGMGIQDIQWGDSKIHAIYQVSFSLWIGSLMQEIDKL